MLTYLIRTSSLDSDERFLKTHDFLKRSGVEVHVFGIVKDAVDLPGTMTQQRLRTRALSEGGRFIALKYLEMLIVTFWFMVRNPGRRWFANFEFLPVQLWSAAFPGRKGRPVWDLHEMPSDFMMRNPVMRKAMRFLLRRCAIIVCNASRRDALQKSFEVDLSDALILRNFPGETARNILVEARNEHLSTVTPEADALNIVIIGGYRPGRYVRESAEAIARLRRETGLDLTLTLVGGPGLDGAGEFVKSTGFLTFEDLVRQSVRGAVTLCFYRSGSLNNKLCEPNRFYQAILSNQYVLTFDHPSLRSIGYQKQFLVDEANFEESLAEVIKAAVQLRLDEPVGAVQASAGLPSASRASFENQFAQFKAWIGQ